MYQGLKGNVVAGVPTFPANPQSITTGASLKIITLLGQISDARYGAIVPYLCATILHDGLLQLHQIESLQT